MKRKAKATGTPKKKRPISDERMMMNSVSQSILCLSQKIRNTKSGRSVQQDHFETISNDRISNSKQNILFEIFGHSIFEFRIYFFNSFQPFTNTPKTSGTLPR